MNTNTQYPVFEADQVLTPKNLNDIVSYLNTQDLKTRRELIGIGVVCGLEVSSDLNSYVEISKGVGVTSKGYLLSIPYCKLSYYKGYKNPSEAPYKPFIKSDGTSYDLWEIFTAKQYLEMDDETVKPLSDGLIDLQEMAVLLFLEIIDKDLEKCIGEDCDEKGISRIHTIRKLIIKKTDLLEIISSTSSKLGLNGFSTIKGYYQKQNPASAMALPALQRFNYNLADLTSLNLGQINSWLKLKNTYKGIINKDSINIGNALYNSFEIHKSLLARAYPAGNPFAGFNGGTTASNALFQLIKFQVNSQPYLIQYAYDFLDDLLQAYYEFWHVSFMHRAKCCPNPDLFPQHLMLGCLYKTTGDLDLYRHYWIPSPAVGGQEDLSEKLMVLHLKMVYMVNNYKLTRYNSTSSIKIVPSYQKNAPSSKKSIGFYYSYSESTPINKFWNYEFYKSQKEDHVLSYFGNQYSTLPQVIKPLLYDIKPFDFYRIEGHIGQEFNTAKNRIQQLITDYNLPVDVLGIKLSTDHLDVDVDDGCFQDIQTVYKANRDEFLSCLDGLIGLLGSFLKVFAAIAKNYPAILTMPINKNEKAGFSFVNTIGDLYLVLQIYVFFLKRLKLLMPEHIKDFHYPQFRISYFIVYAFTLFGQIFLEILSNLINKLSPGALQVMVIKTLFERIIDDCMDAKFKSLYDMYRDRLLKSQLGRLFPGFVGSRPGMEHMAGSPEGGTFILVYDEIKGEKPDFPEKPTPEIPEEEEDPCFEDEKAKDLQLNIMQYAYYAMNEPIILDDLDLELNLSNINRGMTDDFRDGNVEERADALGTEKSKKNYSYGRQKIEDSKVNYQTPNEFLKFLFGPIEQTDIKKERNYRIVADFAIPYRCCSSCLQVDQLPKNDIIITIQPTEFCYRDKKKYPLTLEPEGGKLTSNSGGIVEDDGEFYFQPNATGGQSEDISITYEVEGQSTTTVVKVYNPIASFTERTIDDEKGNTITILESSAKNYDQRHWEIKETNEKIDDDKLVIEHDKYEQETLTISFFVSRESCKDTGQTVLKLNHNEPQEIIIRLQDDTFCHNDKQEYPFQLLPPGGKLTPREYFTEGANGPVFIPAAVNKKKIIFTYKVGDNASSFTANIVAVKAFFEIEEETQNTIVLVNKSKNAEDIEWIVEGISRGSDKKLDLKKLEFDTDVIKVSLMAYTLKGKCKDRYNQEITIRKEVEILLDLQKPKDSGDAYEYCNNDASIYRFMIQPLGAEVKGPGVIVQNGTYFFKPMGMAAGKVTFSYLSQTLEVKVKKAQEISFKAKVLEYDQEHNIAFVEFSLVGSIQGSVKWDLDDDQPITETQEKVVNYEFDFNKKLVYTISISMKNTNACLSTYDEDIDIKSLLGGATTVNERFTGADFGTVKIVEMDRSTINVAIATEYNYKANNLVLAYITDFEFIYISPFSICF